MNDALALPKRIAAEGEIGSPPCIHELFAQQANRTPEAVAVNCGQETLTYRELNERATQLAHYLQKLGVGPEIPVALYLERSPKMVIAILAVLKAGGAYVPMDLAYPQERLAFMLEDTRAPVVVTQESLRTALPTNVAEKVCLDANGAPVPAVGQAICSESAANPLLRAPHANSAAYIIYTSGSTGKPKGVIVTHQNVVRLLRQTEPWYHFNASDVWPLFHSYAFDVSVWELWGSLLYGGRLVIVPYLVTRSPGEFYELLAREQVTVLNQTPSAFRQLIWAEQTTPNKLKLSLRYVICAGEALELQSLKPWFELHGDQQPQVVNMYGITETTVHSTYRVIRQTDLTNGMGSVIGVPIPDLQIYLVDEELKPVPAGVPGEICVGGAGVARGYLNRPELTAKRFLSDPFSVQQGARLYRSGDLAQVNARGELEYLGRMDHQVKIRGFRVELGEIESALNRHPAIRESVVIAQDDSTGGKRLLAYCVAQALPPSVSELREHLGKTLPDYMLPAMFLFLKALPLTNNGKVDRRALPSPDGVRPSLRAQFVKPRTDIEEALAKIWSTVLELDQVGIHDNFFELGGDSIRSIMILARAQQHGWQLALQDIFQNPTIAGLAGCAERPGNRAVFQPTQPFSLLCAEDRAKLPPEVEDAYPIARLQLGMFYYNELNPLSAMYHDVFSYRVQTPFERERLEAAIQRLAQRHPMLRTSFQLAGFSQALQLVHRHATVPFTSEDLRQLDPGEQDRRLADWIETEKRRPFIRSVPPLVRFHTQLRSDDSFQLILSFHHACLDGWSLAAVITELCQDYTGSPAASPSAPRINYRDFVALEQEAILSPETRRFWADKLADATPQILPRWPKALRAGGHEQKRGPEIKIEPKIFAELKALAQLAGVPLKTVLLAAHQRVMRLLYGQTDVISGLICNGRPEELDGEKLIGLFLNTLPLRQRLVGGTWLELVSQTFAAEQELVPHRRFPLAEVQKLVGGQPLFEAAFDFVHFHVYKNLQGCRNLDLAEGHYFEANNLTTYTTFMLDITSTQLELHIDYDPNALCREQIEQMSGYYLHALQGMAAGPHGRYDACALLSPAEQTKILVEWNATTQEYQRSACVHELFEAQAEKTPEAVALIFHGEQLTYRELNLRANRLAFQLRELNVEPGMLVGLCLERSAEMVVALLAILKAGGAYVPLDPTYPKDRLAQMITDANLPLILTQTGLLGNLPDCAAKIVALETLSNGQVLSGSFDSKAHTQHSVSEPLAYVIYTSGSTGKPKAVQVLHRSVVNLLTSAGRTAGITSADNLLAVTTLSFDIAALELFLPLITGGRLTVAPRETAADGTQLAALIESSGATVMQATPATWRLLLEAGWKGKKNLKVFCGGEALKRSLADELLARVQELWNFYGPTETTIWSTAWKVQPNQPISIGRPLANTHLYILDPQLYPVPVGVVGELHIGGDGLARGYLNRPELTAEKFIPNPFVLGSGKAFGLHERRAENSPPTPTFSGSEATSIEGSGLPHSQGQNPARLYKTGDLARFLPDGTVECLGRIDHQVKIRGFRIELGDVETALRQHAGIADALVTARDDVFGEKRLVGYIISKNGPVAATELRDFVRTKLPLHMVPAQFVLLEQFPLTPNGKIDLRRLPAPETGSVPARSYLAPRNVEEQQLAGIWQEVLMLKQVGIDDNFFELGGDSLSATRAFARINNAFGMELSLREILEHPTIRSLNELVMKSKARAPRPASTIPRQPRVLKVK